MQAVFQREQNQPEPPAVDFSDVLKTSEALNLYLLSAASGMEELPDLTSLASEH